MLRFELVALVYFSALPALIAATAAGRRDWWRAVAASVAMAAVVLAAARLLPPAPRAWLGLLYLPAGYWIPALAADAMNARFEAWLAASDARRAGVIGAVPRWIAHAGELAYLLCYPLVPAAFLVVWVSGAAIDVERFWLAVLLAGFSCYVSLPWLAARPPRLLPGAGAAAASGVSELNRAVLSRVSHNLTTFPSGHAAVAVAATLCVASVSVTAGLVFGVVTAGIAIGAVTGRYHYLVDVTTGVVVGALAALAAGAAVAAQAPRAGEEARRIAMVEEQIAARGVTAPAVLDAMRRVPRERFVPADLTPRAYDDRPLPIGHGQTISQPYIVGYMSELLDVAPGHRVLEIGTGSGYQAAILGELAKEVYTIEIVPELAQRAAAALKALGYGHVQVRAGDGYAGWPERAPFDRILLTAAPESIPQPLLDQLAPGGRLVAPVGAQWTTQWIVVVEKTAGGIVERRTIPVQFVPFTRSTPNSPPERSTPNSQPDRKLQPPTGPE